ncbi:uncharacterized protein LOC113364305 [Ctenocephalides felis]|uniref:uncharacterized protein LOC113364305 n=1 Tax=Ctenocephalides felis TaxID=7515 RepID=UPI000E6E595D|nr:uncharacterized protein LOC113364305 [Ctenocephalides felis]
MDENMSEMLKRDLLRIIENEQIPDPLIAIKPVTIKGDNNIGIMLGIEVTSETSDKSLHLVCKSEPKSAVILQEFRINVMFDTERFFYTHLFPLFDKFQDKMGISDEDRFKHYPVCYGFTEAALFMKDMRREGFKMMDKSQPIGYEHAKLAMESLGKFHAMGLVLKDQHPTDFKVINDHLPPDLYGKPVHKPTYDFFKGTMKFARETLEDDEEDLKKKVDYIIENLQTVMLEAVDEDLAEPYTTYSHGDFWNNNVLYRHDEAGKPVEAYLLDFQLSHYRSPCVDIYEYLFSSFDQVFREKYYDQLLKDYHKSACTLMSKLGTDPDRVFPFSALEAQKKRGGMYGVVFASILLKVILGEGAEVYDSEKIAESIKNNDFSSAEDKLIVDENVYKLYKKRMSDVIRHADKLGII